MFTHIRGYLDHLERAGDSPGQIRDRVFQYGPTSGLIREEIADWLRKDESVNVPAQSIVVTVGCQEAMVLTLRALFAGPDDVLLVSTPCYVGITGAARLLDIEVAEVRERADGFHCADLEAAAALEHSRGRRPGPCTCCRTTRTRPGTPCPKPPAGNCWMSPTGSAS